VEVVVRRPITRREFLQRASLGALAVSGLPQPAFARAFSARPTGAAPKRIVVLGAGLSGLAAAFEFVQAGHDVTILEARTRAGGRVLTLRDGFADGLYAEAGAIFVPDHHQDLMRYLRQFDVPLDLLPSSDRSALYYVQGRRLRVTMGQPVNWPVELRPDEQGLAPEALFAHYLQSLVSQIGDPTSASWPPDNLKQYDAVSVAEFARQQGASPGALTVMRLAGPINLVGEGIDSISLLWAMRYLTDLFGARQTYVIRGGSDQLPSAFVSRLGDRVRYSAPVVRIAHTPQDVTVTYLRDGAPATLTGDYAVCTVPFAVLRDLEVAPPFSPPKTRAINELPQTSVTRVFLQTRTRFWSDQGDPGFASTDLPIMTCLDAAVNQAGPRGIMMSFQGGDQARQTAAQSEDERVATAVREMEKVYPGMAGSYEWGTSYSWDQDPWARGDYAWMQPGQFTALEPYIGTPEGRVYFAGEHASPWPGWMQGALWSGLRAARAIMETP
jgi:monoamine oxidase